MKGVVLFFEVHQPLRLKRYRFFEIGNDHYYYDDFTNESILRRVAAECYLPANRILLELIRKYEGEFRVSFSITGVLLDQLELYTPEVIDSFRELVQTGSVEIVAETYAHSLASMADRDEFVNQVKMHSDRVKTLFGVTPTSFRNTELIYSDQIGSWVADMGYASMLTEGARHILGWRSPDFIYVNPLNPKLKILLRNFTLSDDIAFRFSNNNWNEWPLTADKFAGWVAKQGKEGDLVNIFIDYETFGEHQKKETGIFDFLKALPEAILKGTRLRFITPSEAAGKFQPVSPLQVPDAISWADEERDLTAWLGNDLQDAAFNKLYELGKKIRHCGNPGIIKDWEYLQVSDHFYYMCTKFFSDGAVHAYFNPYDSPYDAFMNYMNVLSDLELRLISTCPDNDKNREIRNLSEKIEEQQVELAKRENEIMKLRTKVKSMNAEKSKSASSPAKKTTRSRAGSKGKTTK